MHRGGSQGMTVTRRWRPAPFCLRACHHPRRTASKWYRWKKFASDRVFRWAATASLDPPYDRPIPSFKAAGALSTRVDCLLGGGLEVDGRLDGQVQRAWKFLAVGRERDIPFDSHFVGAGDHMTQFSVEQNPRLLRKTQASSRF